MQCHNNYLRAQVVRFDEQGTQRLKFMLSQFKFEMEINSECNKT